MTAASPLLVPDPERGLTIHVDTSLQIELQKEESRAKPVRLSLKAYVFKSTSTYARKEFKRAWMKDLAYIYTKSKECDNIAQVYSKIDGGTWAANRRRQRMVEAITKFMERLPASTPAGLIVTRLRSHLRNAIRGGFVAWRRQVHHEFDGTECIRATEYPEISDDGSIDCKVKECKPSRVQCSVHKFFKQRQTAFSRIADAIEALGESASEELKKTAATIRRAESDPLYLCDDSNCRQMSDTLIAVDGIEMNHFGAHNPREWKVIAATLGKPLVDPVAATFTPPPP